jgi:NAD(P)-dependent dehydrogenase (short-subunit alcohol dehydrogenase family)
MNAVAPGPIYTEIMQDFWDRIGPPSDALFNGPIAFRCQGAPEEGPNVVVFLLGPESSFVSGSYPVDGAWIMNETRHLTRCSSRLVKLGGVCLGHLNSALLPMLRSL